MKFRVQLINDRLPVIKQEVWSFEQDTKFFTIVSGTLLTDAKGRPIDFDSVDTARMAGSSYCMNLQESTSVHPPDFEVVLSPESLLLIGSKTSLLM